MKEYLVLYLYDYCEMGGHGWEFFNTKEDAEKFIEECMQRSNANIKDFTIFYGEEQKILEFKNV